MGRKTKAQKARAAAKQHNRGPVAHPNVPPQFQQTPAGDTTRRFQEEAHRLKQDPEMQRLIGGFTEIAESLKQASKMPRSAKKGVGPSDTQKQATARRLKLLHDFLSAQPKPLLEQFAELGLEFYPASSITPLSNGKPEELIVLRRADLQQIDRLIHKRGTVYDQLYREEAKLAKEEGKK